MSAVLAPGLDEVRAVHADVTARPRRVSAAEVGGYLGEALTAADRLATENARLREALAGLRDAAQPAYAAGRVDALAFVTAGNVLAEVRDGR